MYLDLNSTNTTIIRTLDNSGNHSIVGYNLCGNSNFSAAPSPVGIRGALFTINDCTVTTGTVSGGGGGHANLVVSDNTNWKVLFNFT